MVYLGDWISVCSFLLLCWILQVRCSHDIRFAEKSFTDSFVYGHHVTCDSSDDTRQIYPAPTWTCTNMRINGMRLRRQYMKQTSKRMEFQSIYDAKNDVKALCQTLLQVHSLSQPIWTAYVKEIATDEITSKRVIFKKTDTAYDWEVLGINRNVTGRGYVRSLACTLVN